MSPLRTYHEKLKCPYEGCGQLFNKPTVLIDSSLIPRQTCYACPYCMSKIDVLTENMKIVGVRATEYPKVLDSLARCAHYSGFLNLRPEETPIPDDCLICPKVLQCGPEKDAKHNQSKSDGFSQGSHNLRKVRVNRRLQWFCVGHSGIPLQSPQIPLV